MEGTDQGFDGWLRRRYERHVLPSRPVVPGVVPGLFDLRLVPWGAEVVETRRLELLTLSLQRRCSAN